MAQYFYHFLNKERTEDLVVGERYWLYSTRYTNYYFKFRVGSVPNISKYKASKRGMWRTQSLQEKKKWYDYVDQYAQIGKTVNSRRKAKLLISHYDDIPKNHYRGSWKHSTKKRRQWGGKVEVIYCG